MILAIDLNNYVIDRDFTLNLQSPRLYKAIYNRHYEEGYQPTCDQGRAPIDGLFISNSLLIIAGGYLPFTSMLSDHRPI